MIRNVERKVANKNDAQIELLIPAKRQEAQQRKDKNKLYSVPAEEVECIAKGKIHKQYVFGNKASFATTSTSNWQVGAQSLQGNPYDGHTLMAHWHR